MHPRHLCDEVADAGKRPEQRLVPVGLGTFQQPPKDRLPLRLGQTRRRTGWSRARKPGLAEGVVALPPAADGLASHLQPPRDFGVGEVLSEQTSGLEASLFELLLVGKGSLFHALPYETQGGRISSGRPS